MTSVRYAFVPGELPVIKPAPESIAGAYVSGRYFVDLGQGGPSGQQPQAAIDGSESVGQVNVPRDLVPLILAQMRHDQLRPENVSAIRIGQSWDVFLGPIEVQHLAVEAVEALCREGFAVEIRTRTTFSHDILERLGRLGSQVLVEVPFVSMRPDIAAQWEPGAATPGERLRSMRALTARGVGVVAQVDPLLPLINDTKSDIEAFCVAFAGTAVQRVQVSYLRLTPELAKAIGPVLSPMHRNIIKGCFAERAWTQDDLGSSSKQLDQALRQRGLHRFLQVAQQHGLVASVCPESDGDVVIEAGQQPKSQPTRRSHGAKLGPVPKVAIAGQMDLF